MAQITVVGVRIEKDIHQELKRIAEQSQPVRLKLYQVIQIALREFVERRNQVNTSA
jgi:predicted transcriptional regulator